MKDALVSIAAGRSQLPLLEAARRAGLAVVAVDRDPDAPGFALADARIVASTHDPGAVVAGLRALPAGLRPVAVATKSSGAPVATAALSADALGLPGLNPAFAHDATEKPGQLAMCERAGVPVPRHHRVGSLDELVALDLPLPLVCKPAATLVGKRGIHLVRAADGLPAAFAAAAAASPDGTVEVEAYLPGHDVVLCGLMHASRLYPVLLFDEDTSFGPGGAVRGLGFRSPSRVAGTLLEASLVRHAAGLVEGLRLGWGVLFATFRVGYPLGRVPTAHVLELHFDLAGDHLADAFLPAATGRPLLEATLDVLRGRAPAPAPREARPSILRFVYASDLAERGEEKRALLAALEDLVALELGDPPADALPADPRLGFCLARGGDEARRRIERALGPEPAW